ncbi:Polypeptide N-acetylgalactosaminyltransferase 3 [Bulinus truncatus]|nr:Polypeptide N-acetylgalactosaminyltransferase 3 [Bulinus truncatus]
MYHLSCGYITCVTLIGLHTLARCGPAGNLTVFTADTRLPRRVGPKYTVSPDCCFLQVVSPYIDTIKAENFEYRRSPARLKGGFNWRLEFGWRAANVAGNLGSEKDSIITPVISGGLFAVWRDYFRSIGSYDPELDIWGGENFELSFKTWMCGGSLEIIPCSRVGHVFRSSLPYSFLRDTEEVVLRNLGRVASVWMDDYAEVFYSAVNMPKDIELGDLSQRIQLRKNLKCHSFQWYLSNVFPQLEILDQDTLNYGMVRNKGSLMCLDVLNSATEFYLGLSPCHGGKNQTFRLSSTNRLSQAEACIKPGMNKQLVLSLCKKNMSWIFQDGFLKLDQTELCLTSVDNEVVQLLPCDFGFETNIVVSKHKQSSNSLDKHHDSDHRLLQAHSLQQWTFDYTFNWKRRRRRRD